MDSPLSSGETENNPVEIDSADSALRKFVHPQENETFDGWTVQQLKIYVCTRSAYDTGRRADLLEWYGRCIAGWAKNDLSQRS